MLPLSQDLQIRTHLKSLDIRGMSLLLSLKAICQVFLRMLSSLISFELIGEGIWEKCRICQCLSLRGEELIPTQDLLQSQLLNLVLKTRARPLSLVCWLMADE